MKRGWNRIKNIFYQQTITTRIILVIAMLSMISNMAFVGGIFLVMKNQLLTKTKSENAKDILMIEKQLEMFFQGIRNDAVAVLVSESCQTLLSNSAEFLEEDTTTQYRKYKLMQSMIMSTIGQRTEYNTIVFYDLDGNCYADDRLLVSGEYLADKQDRVIEFLAGSQNEAVLPIHKSAWRKKKEAEFKDCISYLRKVYNKEQGKLIGVVELEIPNEVVYELYRPIMENGSTVYLAAGDSIISAMETDMLYQDLNQEDWYGSLMCEDSVNGLKILMMERNLYFQKPYSEFGWMIIDVVPTSSYMRDVMVYACIDVMIGIFLLFANIYISRILIVSITKPLSKITATIVNIGQGDFEQRVQVRDGGEIGTLASEFNRMLDKTQQLMRQIVSTEQKKRESELALIQMQMTPHFFYNILESICGLIVLDDKKTAIRTISLLSDFYRGVLNKGREIIEISQELAISVNYLRIMKICHPGKFEYRIDCPDEIRNCHITKLTLQPILENAIHHGFAHMQEPGRITIEGFLQGGNVILEISDNGRGIGLLSLDELQPEQEFHMESFGLKNTNERIRLYFGDAYGITIIQQAVGTKIRIVLPARGE